MAFQQPFNSKTLKQNQELRAAMFVFKSWSWQRADPLIDTSTSILLQQDRDAFQPHRGAPLLMWDDAGWELMRNGWWERNEPIVKDLLWDCERGQFGTKARQFTQGASVADILYAFSTHPMENSTDNDFSFQPYMIMPNGFDSKFLYRDGRTAIGNISIQIIDKNLACTKAFSGSDPGGERVALFIGWGDQPLWQWELAAVGNVSEWEYRNGVYTLQVVRNDERINRRVFSVFDPKRPDESEGRLVTVGTFNIGSGSITLNTGDDIIGNGDRVKTLPNGGTAALYFHVSDGDGNFEIVQLDNLAINTPPTYAVNRAYLGTTEQNWAAGSKVRQFYAIEGNPIDIALHVMLSRATALAAQGDYDLQFGDSTTPAMGMGIDVADVDISSFEGIRDLLYEGQTWRCDFIKDTGMKKYLEDNIFKVLGVQMHIGRDGRLRLASFMAPSYGLIDGTTITRVRTIDNSNFRQLPTMSLGDQDLITEVVLNYDYDAFEDTYANKLVLTNPSKEDKHRKSQQFVMNAKGVRNSTDATANASRRSYVFGKSVGMVSMDVDLGTAMRVEAGENVELIIDDVPDPGKGKLGLSAPAVLTDRRVRVDTAGGTLVALHSLFQGKVGHIGPARLDGLDVSDTQEDRDIYCALCDDDGLLPDGEEGFVFI